MGRACAKVILTGEHSVVYGAPALVCGIERGVQAEAFASDAAALDFGPEASPANPETLRAFEQLLQSLGAPPCRVNLQLNMPTGVGLGASAALGVAAARAVLAHLGRAPDPATILQAADAWERVFHGNPSGVDAAAAYHGGCLRFTRETGAQQVKLPQAFTLVIALAGPPSSTKEMVSLVASFQQRNPQQFERNLEALTVLANNAQSCLENADFSGLGTLLDYNHLLLAGWFLSSPAIEECRQLAQGAGALGSKLTGAGGGGCVIAVPGADGSEPILQAWKAAGYAGFATRINPRSFAVKDSA